MKKIIICMLSLIFVLFCFSGCDDNSNKISGVYVNDNGNVAITFTVPNGKTVQEIIGSEIGKENTFFISSVTEDINKGSYTYWYKVDNGGILSKCGNVYRYAPTAAVSFKTGVSAPPSWAMLYKTPSEDEIFNPDNAELLAESYGIKLYFK